MVVMDVLSARERDALGEVHVTAASRRDLSCAWRALLLDNALSLVLAEEGDHGTIGRLQVLPLDVLLGRPSCSFQAAVVSICQI